MEEAPDEFHLEPQKVNLGRLVHDVFEGFYRSLQLNQGEPVRLTDYERSELEERLPEQTHQSLMGADLASAESIAR